MAPSFHREIRTPRCQITIQALLLILVVHRLSLHRLLYRCSSVTTASPEHARDTVPDNGTSRDRRSVRGDLTHHADGFGLRSMRGRMRRSRRRPITLAMVRCGWGSCRRVGPLRSGGGGGRSRSGGTGTGTGLTLYAT